jgi:hypothetical protein
VESEDLKKLIMIGFCGLENSSGTYRDHFNVNQGEESNYKEC